MQTGAAIMLLGMVRALVRAVEAKDFYTRWHSEQVAHYAVHLAQRLGLEAKTVESIRIAALLHDVGKIGVPDHILVKPGPLTEEEFAIVRRHPGMGAEILSHIAMLDQEAVLVRHHHERWDGGGYPEGLFGDQTPLGARLIQISDSIDAMLMERTYKRCYSPEKMIDELVRCAGKQFDPVLAGEAVQWCRANPDKLVLPRKRQSEQASGRPSAHAKAGTTRPFRQAVYVPPLTVALRLLSRGES